MRTAAIAAAPHLIAAAIAATDEWNCAAVIVAAKVCVLRLLRRHLDECAAAIAAADEWMSNRLRAAAIAAAPRQICGGGRVELCGGACGGERFGCVMQLFRRRLDECAAAIVAADEWLCTLAAAIAAADELK